MIAVTGSSGLVGGALCRHWRARGQAIRPISRAVPPGTPELVAVGDVGPDTDWRVALEGVSCVVHCAARVHVMNDTTADPLAEFRRVNRDGTRRLAEQAVQAGVRRLVFISSVKVHGEQTDPGKPFTHLSKGQPSDAYSVSKWEAEQVLWETAARTGLEVVVVRPPLVYGPGVKANFARLLGLVRRGIPLPFALVRNRRALVGLDNLVSCIDRCCQHPAASGEAFMVSDGCDLSTADLIRTMARAASRRALLLPVPPAWLLLAGRVTGQTADLQRLLGSLEVDIQHTRDRLSWAPETTIDATLKQILAPFDDQAHF